MSRLLNNSDQLRDQIEARNLYTPETPYSIDSGQVVNIVNALAGIVRPFTNFDLGNTVVGRLVGDETPLSVIGLEMLAKQFAATVASNSAAQFFPDVKFENIFDGDPDTKFLMKRVDYQITRRETQTNIGRILEGISGRVDRDTPFKNNPNNLDYLRNTGKGQLQLLFRELNRNLYKPSSREFVSFTETEGFQYGVPARVIDNSIYFDGNNSNFYPFDIYRMSGNLPAINDRLSSENVDFLLRLSGTDRYLEYGGSQDFIDKHGRTIIRNNAGAGNYNFANNAEYNYGLNEDPTQQIVWGRDGVDSEYRGQSQGFDKPFEGVQPSGSGGVEDKNSRFSFNDRFTNFGSEKGLLNYTKELLNSKGRYATFDLTRKKFIDRDGQVHFNGSPLSERVTDEIDRNRQHSIADPYDSYVKAIRYNGNKIYGGNQNSTVYDTVIPKIFPYKEEDENGNPFNVRNMFFSIENLAAETVLDGIGENSVCRLKDDFGTELPLCECGPRNGRIMWFPPYDIRLNEQSIAKHETNTFIGRGEPIYTYANTERQATLSFKLLIDYPPQTRGRDHVYNSRFFAFGGESDRGIAATNISQKRAQIEELKRQRDGIEPVVETADVAFDFPDTISYYFLNDEPGNRLSIENVVIEQTEIGYEDGIENDNLDRDTGLNVNFNNNFEDIINLWLSEERRDYVKLKLVGSASELFLDDARREQYNIDLSQRRIDAILAYINSIYAPNNGGRTIQEDGIEIDPPDPLGGVGDELTDDVDEINTSAAKKARRVTIKLSRSSRQITKEIPLSQEQLETKAKLDEQIRELEGQIAQQKRGVLADDGCSFERYTLEDGILKGFESAQKNKYQPVFHSQTPEDFHRRLTFLQQCTRQGNAIRKLREENGQVTFSANNSVFGRQPVQILRLGDFFHTKVIINNINFDYSDAPWDFNPEGMGAQFMIADITISMKIIGGQSLKTAVDALQNAVSFNYYANSTFYNDGVYATATAAEDAQVNKNNPNLGRTNNSEDGQNTTEDNKARDNKNVGTE
jgi:hypothetical protein